ncbi:MAG: DUF4932 domain-containing protein [Flavobacteriales bacterium]|nr:DUF4932 domain-containing protein [Flavobacteriales bacterium]
MNKLIIAFFSFILISCGTIRKNHDSTKEGNKKVLTVHTDTNAITIKFNEQSFPWKINDDKLSFPYNGKTNKITFITPVDTLQLSLPEGKSIPIDIVLNKTDTIRATVVGISKPATFDTKYIVENKGEYVVCSSKVHELINIAFALTDVGKTDHNMVNNNTAYYDKVLTHFEKYKNHSLIDSLNQNMKNDAYGYYYNLRMNACMYSFIEEKNIVNNSPYNRLGWGADNYLEELLPTLEAFANDSKFENFYSQNSEYYQSLTDTYYRVVPINKMWQWLESRFSERYDGYKIYFSSLVGGAHSTEYFSNNGYKETVMFIDAPIFPKEYSLIEQELEASRVVFTEIDHNYINPISDTLSSEINNSFSNRFFWVLDDPGLNGYPTPYKVFNEYMTWALYSLYCADTFAKEDYEKYNKKVENIMVKKRGFIKFKEFNQKLLVIYSNNKDIEMTDLIKSILEWSKQNQNSIKN